MGKNKRTWILHVVSHITRLKGGTKMYVQELLDILNNKEEIPNPEVAELCFFLTQGEDESDLKLVHIGAFDISTDVTVGFEID